MNFKKHPIYKTFKDLTENQRMSIHNLLLYIALCDSYAEDEARALEFDFIHAYIPYLSIDGDKAFKYLQEKGTGNIITDLIPLLRKQKELLIKSTYDLMGVDSPPNETEISVAITMFIPMGISEEEYVNVIQKHEAEIKLFKGL